MSKQLEKDEQGKLGRRGGGPSRMLRWSGLALALLVGFAACSSFDETAKDSGDGDFPGGSGPPSAGAGGFPGMGPDPGPPPEGWGGEPQLPEEREEDRSFRTPVVTGSYLWSSNPQSGRVALIDAENFGVRLATAGYAPTYLAAVPREDGAPSAVVLNVGSSTAATTASWFRMEKGELSVRHFPVHRGANHWQVSEKGSFALAWTRQEVGAALDLLDGNQELTLLRLDAAAPQKYSFVVDFLPNQVLFSQDESRVVVVSEESLTILSLGAEPRLTRRVDLGLARGRDVTLTSDARFALIRRAGESHIQLLDLDAPGAPLQMDLGGEVSDLSVSESGRVVAVLRTRSEVVTFQFSDSLEDLSEVERAQFPQELLGSVRMNRAGTRAVLFSTAIPHRRVTVLDLSPGPQFLQGFTYALSTPVWEVLLNESGEHAVVLGGEGRAQVKSLTVLSLSSPRFPRVVGTESEILQIALDEQAVIATTEEAQSYLVGLPDLALRKQPLASVPLGVGVLRDHPVAYVAQEHAEGRITFFQLDTGKVRTLTGYELSEEVVSR